MKKNNRTLKIVVLTSIISILLTSSIGVVALTLYADDIIYTPANTNWKIDNAESALNDLYTMTNTKLTENYNNGYNAGYNAGYTPGYNAGVAAGKPSKTQTISQGCGADEGSSDNCTFTFGQLSQVLGISALTNAGTKIAITKMTISGNVVTLRVANDWSWASSKTFTVTAIGY